jgi:hypothetical protein
VRPEHSIFKIWYLIRTSSVFAPTRGDDFVALQGIPNLQMRFNFLACLICRRAPSSATLSKEKEISSHTTSSPTMATSPPSALLASHDMASHKSQPSGDTDPDQLADYEGGLHASSPDTPGTVDAEDDSEGDSENDENEEDADAKPLPLPTPLTKTKRHPATPPARYSGIASFTPSLTGPAEEHPDIDLTNPKYAVRLLSLLQHGWKLARGLGHRGSNCLWCRGPLAVSSQILTHQKCQNTWAASCLVSSS